MQERIEYSVFGPRRSGESGPQTNAPGATRHKPASPARCHPPAWTDLLLPTVVDLTRGKGARRPGEPQLANTTLSVGLSVGTSNMRTSGDRTTTGSVRYPTATRLLEPRYIKRLPLVSRH